MGVKRVPDPPPPAWGEAVGAGAMWEVGELTSSARFLVMYVPLRPHIYMHACMCTFSLQTVMPFTLAISALTLLTNSISQRLASVGAEGFLTFHGCTVHGTRATIYLMPLLRMEICVFSFFTIKSNTVINILLGPVIPYVFQDNCIVKP